MVQTSTAIGIRLPKDLLKEIERISKSEAEDRSTTLRKLVLLGLDDMKKKKAAEKYKKGDITLSEAAAQSSFTIFEMERYLVENGFKSEYSVEDLRREVEMLSGK